MKKHIVILAIIIFASTLVNVTLYVTGIMDWDGMKFTEALLVDLMAWPLSYLIINRVSAFYDKQLSKKLS